MQLVGLSRLTALMLPCTKTRKSFACIRGAVHTLWTLFSLLINKLAPQWSAAQLMWYANVGAAVELVGSLD